MFRTAPTPVAAMLFLTALSAQEVAESQPRFAIAPALVDVGTERAILTWRLVEPAPVTVRWGTTAACTDGRNSVAAGAQQRALLEALAPGTVYHYRVGASEGGQFRTDPKDGTMTFVAVGHTHGTESFDHYPDELLVDALDRHRPDFVVHAGDAVWQADWPDFAQNFYGLFAPLMHRAPVYLAPGNHDAGWPFWRGVDLRPFREMLPYDYPAAAIVDRSEAFHRCTKGHMQFLFLSYTSDLRPEGRQLSWLRTLTERSPYRFDVAVFGGAGRYYDEPALLDYLANHGVEFVIRGDAVEQTPVLRKHGDMRMYYVGTGSGSPHRFLHFTVRDQALTVYRVWSSGRCERVDHMGSGKPARHPQPRAAPKAPVGTVALEGAPRRILAGAPGGTFDDFAAVFDPEARVVLGSRRTGGRETRAGVDLLRIGAGRPLVGELPNEWIAAAADLFRAVIVDCELRQVAATDWQALARANVDLLLVRASSGQRQQVDRQHGVLAFGVGDGSGTAPLVLLERCGSHLLLKQLFADRRKGVYRWLYLRTEHEPRYQLPWPPSKVRARNGITAAYFDLNPPLDTADLHGLQLRCQVPVERRRVVCAYLQPKATVDRADPCAADFSGFRSQHHWFGRNDSLVTLELPLRLPQTNDTYEVRKLVLEFPESDPKVFEFVTAAWLY